LNHFTLPFISSDPQVTRTVGGVIQNWGAPTA
jgi:hypothetical protein